jgi:sugar lactone lactonase YvrE
MLRVKASRVLLALTVAAGICTSGRSVGAQGGGQAVRNDLPNPYQAGQSFGPLPDGRKWGSTAGVDVDPKGVNIWAYDRCGANSCADSNAAPIVEFDPSGKLLRSFGAGAFLFPHGIHVDRDGNVWVTDQQVNPERKKGVQVVKFSPEGKVLLTLGTAGVVGEGPDTFGAPTDVLVAPSGDIFVSDGHTGCKCPNNRIVKFSKDGKFIKAWGKTGTGPGELDGPHSLAMDSKGRLFVGDRTNNRVVIYDQEGKFIAAWKQFGRPSGVFIDKSDTLYVADSESTDKEGYGYNPGVKRGIRIGSAADGTVKYFIPDPDPKGGSSAAEGVAVDAKGNVYGAEVGPKDLKRYVKK